MWSNQREAILRCMWKDGASASIIGDELGITRNAVIGKVHRLGLEARLPTFKHTSRIAPIGRPISKPPQRIVSVMTVTVSKSKSKPELTKGELRRLFEEAWRNTAILQPTENRNARYQSECDQSESQGREARHR